MVSTLTKEGCYPHKETSSCWGSLALACSVALMFLYGVIIKEQFKSLVKHFACAGIRCSHGIVDWDMRSTLPLRMSVKHQCLELPEQTCSC